MIDGIPETTYLYVDVKALDHNRRLGSQGGDRRPPLVVCNAAVGKTLASGAILAAESELRYDGDHPLLDGDRRIECWVETEGEVTLLPPVLGDGAGPRHSPWSSGTMRPVAGGQVRLGVRAVAGGYVAEVGWEGGGARLRATSGLVSSVVAARRAAQDLADQLRPAFDVLGLVLVAGERINGLVEAHERLYPYDR